MAKYLDISNLKVAEIDDTDFSWYNDEYQSALTADDPDRLRCIRNIAAYTGLAYGQYDSSVIQALTGDGRTPETYNLIAYYVEGLTGNYVANWFDPTFIPNRDEDIDVVAEAQRVYFIDKERFQYKAEMRKGIVNGMCYRGVWQWYLDRTRDPRGDIRLVSKRPDLVIIDPSVQGDNLCGAAKKEWDISYLTAEQMMYLFRSRTDKILSGIAKQDKESARTFQRQSLTSTANLNGQRKIGKQYQVVQHLHLEVRPIEFLIDGFTGKTIPFIKNSAKMKELALSRGVDLEISEAMGSLHKMTSYMERLWTTTWCPQLRVMLENREDERQIGRLPTYDWSFITKNGKSIGLVDLLWDTQQDFNKIQVSKRQWLTQTPKRKPVFHDDMWAGNDTLKKESIYNLSDPSKPITLPSGSPPPSQVIGYLENGEPPNLLYQSEQLELQLFSLISRMPPVLSGMSERTNESGVLYGRKVIEANILQRVPVEKLVEVVHDISEGWLLLAKDKYGGLSNINRTFMSSEGNFKAVLNEDMGLDPITGQRVIAKDISQMELPGVMIVVSKENDYAKQAKREMDTEILKAMTQSPDPSNTEIRAMFENRLLLNSDFTDSGEKEAAEAAVKRRNQLLSLQMDTMIAGATAAKQQVEQQIMAGQMGGVAPQQGQVSAPPPAIQTGPSTPMVQSKNLPSREEPQFKQPPVAPIKSMV